MSALFCNFQLIAKNKVGNVFMQLKLPYNCTLDCEPCLQLALALFM